jgi:hypothetical protein
VAICCGVMPGSHARRPKAYQLACPKGWPVQSWSVPMLEMPAMPVVGYGRAFAIGIGVGVEDLLHQRRFVDEVAALPEVFLRDLEFCYERSFGHGCEEGGKGFAGLKVDGTVLDLDEDVGPEFTVKGSELAVGLFEAVGSGDGLSADVVYEGAPDDDAAVGGQGIRKEVGAIGVGPSVGGRL